jgi:nicotinate-nucleotide adenylyltransferase
MKIGIYGISGNPPHVGHVSVAKIASKYVDEIWVMPCYSHRFGKHLVNPDHRLKMCELAFDGLAGVKIDSFEIDNKRDDGTYKVLLDLARCYPDVEFIPIIGQDNANTIRSWAFYDNLIRDFKFLIVARKGIERQQFPGAFEEINLDGPIISSTDIRKKIILGESIVDLVDVKVLDYIASNGLYLL